MAPKKKEVVEERPILGRFSSHLKIGIVGLPNVGKSSTFNLLTKLSIPAENFPFCTIEPNHARVKIPDDRFKWLCEAYKPKSMEPAFLEVVDIAGLVKGAASGEGLGNAFLSNITVRHFDVDQAVDGIFHVLRTFEDPDVIHTEDRVDPLEDMKIIHHELRAKDIERVIKIVDVRSPLSCKRLLEQGFKSKRVVLKKEEKEDLECAERVKALLEGGTDIRCADWNVKEVDFLNRTQFITSKPVVYLVNMSKKDFIRKKNKHLMAVMNYIKENGNDPCIPYSASFEQEIFEMPDDEKAAVCKENGVISMLDRIITTGFKAIRLIYFFTAGPDEVKCWQIRRGTKAPQAAGTIHGDFERGFICAEVMTYDDLHELGSEMAVKAAGKYRQQGKDYTMGDGDIVLFKFNVTSAKK